MYIGWFPEETHTSTRREGQTHGLIIDSMVEIVLSVAGFVVYRLLLEVLQFGVLHLLVGVHGGQLLTHVHLLHPHSLPGGGDTHGEREK